MSKKKELRHDSVHNENMFLASLNHEDPVITSTHLLEEILGRKLNDTRVISNFEDENYKKSSFSRTSNIQSIDQAQKKKHDTIQKPGLANVDDQKNINNETGTGGNDRTIPTRVSMANDQTSKDIGAAKEKNEGTSQIGNRSDRISEGFEFRIRKVPSKDRCDSLSRSDEQDYSNFNRQIEPSLENNVMEKSRMNSSGRSIAFKRSFTENQDKPNTNKTNKILPVRGSPRGSTSRATLGNQLRMNELSNEINLMSTKRSENSNSKIQEHGIYQNHIEYKKDDGVNTLPEKKNISHHAQNNKNPDPEISRVETPKPLRNQQSQNKDIRGGDEGSSEARLNPNFINRDFDSDKHQLEIPQRGIQHLRQSSNVSFNEKSQPSIQEMKSHNKMQWEGKESPSVEKEMIPRVDSPNSKKGILLNKNKLLNPQPQNPSVYDVANRNRRSILAPASPTQARSNRERVRFEENPTVWVVPSLKGYHKEQGVEVEEKKCCKCQLI